jgi:hypothetical protein
MTISRSFFLKMTNVSDKTPTERHNTNFIFNFIFKNFFSETRAVYEIMWENVL